MNSDSQLVSLYGESVKGKFTRNVDVAKGKLNKDAEWKGDRICKKIDISPPQAINKNSYVFVGRISQKRNPT